MRFSIDDWNARLFFIDRRPEADFGWFYERVQRSCAQMRETAGQVLEAGRPVVFDCGFTDAKERGIFLDWAAALGEPACVHFLDVARDTRWQRVERRNAERGETFALAVTREMFEFMETIWQAPTEAELAGRSARLLRI